MHSLLLPHADPQAISLNQPSTLLHWSIFEVTVANLVLIAVMVVIFGAALLLPFPGRRRSADAAAGEESAGGTADSAMVAAATVPDDEDARMWTARVRRRALAALPPGKLLPDRQPAYVASWIYVFGVGALAALGVAIVSGFGLALGGPDWWHYNPIGHFFNSLHLWSVELFMALLVIHLWGKFWMAAWRGRRSLTWITGVIAFVASVIECFTGYLSQQNFDSQWISASGKDAFNSVGVGAFFNVMNFGQMLMWHIVLIPIVLIAVVGAHVLMVRVRGVAHPLPARRLRWRERPARRAAAAADAAPWRGATRRYDILKEGTIASVIVLALTLGLAGLLSSPDVPPLTIATWARLDPSDFLTTAGMELNGTSETAAYGPPYNQQTGSVQRLGFSPQTWFGITQPVNAAHDFVLAPLAKLAPRDPALAASLATYRAGTAGQQQKWASAYVTAVAKVKFASGTPVVPAAGDGPVPAMLAAELTLARSGALDTDLITQQQFYGTNPTKALLFIEDGGYFVSKAGALNLGGSPQWGVMNETGSYPGQPWLWLYTLWYQVPGFTNSANVDMIAIYLTGLATMLLLFIPFVPGLRDIPRLVPVHRLIWRQPRDTRAAGPDPDPVAGPGAGPTTSAPPDEPIAVPARSAGPTSPGP
jgi:Cytochrome b(N-terminal)/b6/petB